MEKEAASLLREKWVFVGWMQTRKITFTACPAYSTSSMEMSSPNYRRGSISSIDLSRCCDTPAAGCPSIYPAPEACPALPSGAQSLKMNTASGVTCCLFIFLVDYLFIYVIIHVWSQTYSRMYRRWHLSCTSM